MVVSEIEFSLTLRIEKSVKPANTQNAKNNQGKESKNTGNRHFTWFLHCVDE